LRFELSRDEASVDSCEVGSVSYSPKVTDRWETGLWHKQIWWEMERFKSKLSPKFRAQSACRMVTLEDTSKAGSAISATYELMTRNSVLAWLRVMRFEDIQLGTSQLSLVSVGCWQKLNSAKEINSSSVISINMMTTCWVRDKRGGWCKEWREDAQEQNLEELPGGGEIDRRQRSWYSQLNFEMPSMTRAVREPLYWGQTMMRDDAGE